MIRQKTPDMELFNSYQSYHGWLKEEIDEEYTTVYFRIFDLDHFARWYISFADIATIVQPTILKNKVLDLIRKIQSSSPPMDETSCKQ